MKHSKQLEESRAVSQAAVKELEQLQVAILLSCVQYLPSNLPGSKAKKLDWRSYFSVFSVSCKITVGCLIRIPVLLIFPSRIQGQKDSGSGFASKNLSIFNPKTVSKLLEMAKLEESFLRSCVQYLKRIFKR